MTWMLTASGKHEPGAGVADWRETEHRLVDELKTVLSKPEYGAYTSWFRGIHVATSAVHHPPETPETPEPAVAKAVPAADSGPDAAAETKQPSRRGKPIAASADGA